MHSLPPGARDGPPVARPGRRWRWVRATYAASGIRARPRGVISRGAWIGLAFFRYTDLPSRAKKERRVAYYRERKKFSHGAATPTSRDTLSSSFDLLTDLLCDFVQGCGSPQPPQCSGIVYPEYDQPSRTYPGISWPHSVQRIIVFLPHSSQNSLLSSGRPIDAVFTRCPLRQICAMSVRFFPVIALQRRSF